MKNLRPFVIVILLQLLLLHTLEATPTATPAKNLSLQECITIGLKNATSVAKAQNNLRLQGADALRSYGGFLPKVSASTSYVPYALNRSFTSIYTGTGTDLAKIKTTSETVDMTVTTSLNIFNGFRDFAALKASLQRQEAAELSLSRAKQAIVFDITQSYYQALLDQELLGIARENLQSSRDLLTLTDRQFQIGLKSVTDFYQQQAEVSNNELTAIKAENQQRRSKLDLVNRLRLDPLQPITLEPVERVAQEVHVPVINIDSLVTYSLQHRNDLKASTRTTRAARWQITQARADRYPKLDVSFNLSTNGTKVYRSSFSGGLPISYNYPPLSDQLRGLIGNSVVVSMNWTIFDGFMTSYNVQSAKINHLNQQLDNEDLKENIVIGLQQSAGDYAAAFNQIASARINLKAAQSAYDGIRKKYELGASGFVELSASRAALFNAKSNLTQATYNLALQKAILDFTTGSLAFDEQQNPSQQ